MKRVVIIGIIIGLLSMIMVGVAAAQDEEPTCTPVEEAGSVEGTVIGVDEEAGTADILLEDGTCVTVTLEQGDYDHPIVALLAAYFGGASLADYADALDVLELEEGVVTGLEQQADGTWLATLDTGETLVIDDEELAEQLNEALAALEVSLDVTLDDDGEALLVEDVGEQIEAYHEDGIGFGVLVKIYAIAAESAEACAALEEEEEAGGEDSAGEGEEPADEDEVDDCAVTVEQLIEDFQSMGIGQLFKLYGKPSLLGVGHVRKALYGGSTATTGAGDDGGGGSNHGVCNARSRGGNAHARGQDITCP